MFRCHGQLVEVQQQTDTDAGGAKIGGKLRVADRQKGGNDLDFLDELTRSRGENASALARAAGTGNCSSTDSDNAGPVRRCSPIANPVIRSVPVPD